MINFRELFNPSYNIIGIIIIVILLIVLFLLEDGLGEFLLNVGIIGIVTGIIGITLAGIIYLILKFLPSSYKIFVTIISDNVIKGIISCSIIVLIVGIILYLVSIFFDRKLESNVN